MLELGLDSKVVGGISFGMAVEDRFRNAKPRHLLEDRIDRGELGHALIEVDAETRVEDVPRDHPFRIAGKIEIGIERGPLGHIAHVDAGLADALHGHETDHRAGPFVAGGIAAGAAESCASARGEIGLFRPPFPGQGADVFGGYARFVLLPLGRLRDAVLFAEDIVSPFLETDGAVRYIFLVVEVFRDPHVGDSQGEGVARGGTGGEPLAAEQGGGMVVIGVYVDHLDAELLEPLAPDRVFKGRVTACGFGVARPEDHHLAFLETVFDRAVDFGSTEARALSPVVHGPPIPTLPTIGIMGDRRPADGI